MRPDGLEKKLRERLDALGPAPRAELLHVLMLPDFDRADRIGEFWGYPESRAFAELLIDCEEDRTLWAVPGCCGRAIISAEVRWTAVRHLHRPARSRNGSRQPNDRVDQLIEA
jgi:hypothetical protein